MSQSTKKEPMETLTEAWKKGDQIQGVAALQFVKVSDFTTFDAQFAITEGDIVVQFFFSPEIKAWAPQQQIAYWGKVFPSALEPAAKKTFNADFPRLKAQHIYEPDLGINSWWFRAYGFGHLLDPHKLVYAFLEELDRGLDTALNRT